jgi:hypothetical protein
MQIRPSQTNVIANDATAQTRPRERASSTNAFRQALAGVKTDMQMVTVKPGDTLMHRRPEPHHARAGDQHGADDHHRRATPAPIRGGTRPA